MLVWCLDSDAVQYEPVKSVSEMIMDERAAAAVPAILDDYDDDSRPAAAAHHSEVEAKQQEEDHDREATEMHDEYQPLLEYPLKEETSSSGSMAIGDSQFQSSAALRPTDDSNCMLPAMQLLRSNASIDEDDDALLLPSAPFIRKIERWKSEYITTTTTATTTTIPTIDVADDDVNFKSECVSLPSSPSRLTRRTNSGQAAAPPSSAVGLFSGLLNRMPAALGGWVRGKSQVDLFEGRTLSSRVQEEQREEEEREDAAAAPPQLAATKDCSLSPTSKRRRKLRTLLQRGFLQAIKDRKAELDNFTLLASYYAQDAFAGRLKHGLAEMSKKTDKDPHIFRCFVVQTSDWWMHVVLWSNIAHCALVLFETPNHLAQWGFQRSWLRALEVLLIMVYVADVALKWRYMGRKDYMAKPWQACFVYVTALLLLDALSFSTVRLARPLRPTILCLRGRSVRRFFSVIHEMLPAFVKVCAPLFLFIVLFSSFAAMAFGSQQPLFATPATASYNVWILTICTENYSALLDGDLSKNPLYLAMFFIMLAIGNIFLLSMLLGVTYDVFLAHTKDQVEKERLKELQGLTKAFQTMDPDGKGIIDKVVWDAFLRNLKPELTNKEVNAYFYLATNFADELDVISFLNLRAVLTYYHFGPTSSATESGLRGPMIHFLRHKKWRIFFMVVVLLDLLLLPYDVPTSAALAASSVSQLSGGDDGNVAPWPVLPEVSRPTWSASDVTTATAYGYALLPQLMTYASAFCTTVLTAEAFLQIIARMPAFWSARPSTVFEGLRTKLKLKYPVKDIVIDAIKDSCLKLAKINSRFRGSLNPHERFCCLVIVMQFGLESYAIYTGRLTGHFHGFSLKNIQGEVGGRGGGGMAADGTKACSDVSLMLLKVMFGLRLLRCWRVVGTNESLCTYVTSFFQILPIFAQCLGIALIVAFSFAMMAMDLFGARTERFSDAWGALLTMIQVFFGVNFDEVLGNTMGGWGRWGLLFFVSYYILGVLIVFNFINAIIIQFYSETLNQRSLETVEKQKLRETHLQEALLRQLTKERVVKAFGGKVGKPASGSPPLRGEGTTTTDGGKKGDVTAESYHKLIAQEGGVNTSADLRRSLAVGNQPNKVSVEELKLCAKYSNVDLVAMHRKKKEAVNDFEKNLFEQLLLESEKAGEGVEFYEEGTYIISMGDMYVPCYFVRSGAVELCYPDGSKRTIKKGNMFGEMSLLADEMPQPADCVVVSPGGCYVLVVHRKHVIQLQNSVENMGMLAMRLNKGGSFLHTPSVIDRARSVSKSMMNSRGGSFSPRTSAKGQSPAPGGFEGFTKQDSVEMYSTQSLMTSPGGTHLSYLAVPMDQPHRGDRSGGQSERGDGSVASSSGGVGGSQYVIHRASSYSPRSPPPSSAPPFGSLHISRTGGAGGNDLQSLNTPMVVAGVEADRGFRSSGSGAGGAGRITFDDSWAMRKEGSSSSIGSGGSGGRKDRPPVYTMYHVSGGLPRQGSFGRRSASVRSLLGESGSGSDSRRETQRGEEGGGGGGGSGGIRVNDVDYELAGGGGGGGAAAAAATRRPEREREGQGSSELRGRELCAELGNEGAMLTAARDGCEDDDDDDSAGNASQSYSPSSMLESSPPSSSSAPHKLFATSKSLSSSTASTFAPTPSPSSAAASAVKGSLTLTSAADILSEGDGEEDAVVYPLDSGGLDYTLPDDGPPSPRLSKMTLQRQSTLPS